MTAAEINASIDALIAAFSEKAAIDPRIDFCKQTMIALKAYMFQQITAAQLESWYPDA